VSGDVVVNWLKHAFAIDKPGPADPTPQQQHIVETVCAEIVRRRLATPALLFLEMSRPLNNLESQALHFLTPFLSVLTEADTPAHLADFLEQRGSIDYICGRIEHLTGSTAKTPTEAQDNSPLKKERGAGALAESSERAEGFIPSDRRDKPDGSQHAVWGLPAVDPSHPQQVRQSQDDASRQIRSDSTDEAGMHCDD